MSPNQPRSVGEFVLFDTMQRSPPINSKSCIHSCSMAVIFHSRLYLLFAIRCSTSRFAIRVIRPVGFLELPLLDVWNCNAGPNSCNWSLEPRDCNL